MPFPEQDRAFPKSLRRLDKVPGYINSDETSGGFKKLELSVGRAQFPSPSEYREIRRKLEDNGTLADSGEDYPEIGLERAENSIRRRFGISEDPYITFAVPGSDAIIDRLPRIFNIPLWDSKIKSIDKHPKTLVCGIGPQFTTMHDAVSEYNNELMQFHVITPPLTESINTSIRNMIERKATYERLTMGGFLVINICNPGTPKGDVASLDRCRELVNTFSDAIVIFDEAFGDVLPDDESAIRLTDEGDNVVALRSVSKIVGLAGERVGYAVMSPKIGEVYAQKKRHFSIPGPTAHIINELFDSNVIPSHLDKIRGEIIKVKTRFMERLTELEVPYLPTDPRVPIMMIDGRDDEFYNRLKQVSFKCAPGSGFSATFPSLSNRYVRLVVPPTTSEAMIAARRLKGAMLAA